MLDFEDLDHEFTHYKDMMLSIETVQSHIGGVGKGRCLNIIAFPADMRCLTVIMMFNLYPVKKIVRTYMFHLLRTYVMILCNWLIL